MSMLDKLGMLDKLSIRFVFSKLYVYYGILGVSSLFYWFTESALITYIFFVLFSMLCCITMLFGVLVIELSLRELVLNKNELQFEKLSVSYFFVFLKSLIGMVVVFLVLLKLTIFLGFVTNCNWFIVFITNFCGLFGYDLYKMKKDLNFLKTLL